MKSIFSDQTLGALLTLKKYLSRFAVGVLIFGVVMGVLAILFGDISVLQTGEIVNKFMSTLFIIGVMLVVTTWEIKLIQSKRPSVQILAMIGLVSNLAWALLWTTITWVPDLISASCSYSYTSLSPICRSSALAKIAVISTALSLFGLLCSAIMNMYEGDRKDVILPLKITSASLVGYETLFLAIVVMLDGQVNNRFVILSIFAGVVWFLVWIVTFVMSRVERKRIKNLEQYVSASETDSAQVESEEQDKPEVKSDEELRAEIEEQVRREMIEKEVRAKLKAEKTKGKSEK